VPRKDGQGRIALLEILKATLRTREYVEQGENAGKTLLDAMRDGAQDGMQFFDGEIEKLIRAGAITIDVGMSYSTNPTNLRLSISDVIQAERAASRAAEAASAPVAMPS
jgi:twitching motility protein PilT